MFFISCLIELKFCKASRNSISNWTWKFQPSILKNKKVLFLKKIFFKPLSISKQKSFVYWPNFQWRFWFKSLFLTLSQEYTPCLFLRLVESVFCIRENGSSRCQKFTGDFPAPFSQFFGKLVTLVSFDHNTNVSEPQGSKRK